MHTHVADIFLAVRKSMLEQTYDILLRMNIHVVHISCFSENIPTPFYHFNEVQEKPSFMMSHFRILTDGTVGNENLILVNGKGRRVNPHLKGT